LLQEVVIDLPNGVEFHYIFSFKTLNLRHKFLGVIPLAQKPPLPVCVHNNILLCCLSTKALGNSCFLCLLVLLKFVLYCFLFAHYC